jgi:hypothetical protein
MEDIKELIINEYTYNRMIDENSGQWETYNDFYEWNVKCLAELTPDDAIWLTGTCKRIKTYKIKLMDEESCSKFEAYWFFIDSDKKIVLVNPR